MMLLSHTPGQFTSFFQPYWVPQSDGSFELKTGPDLLPPEVHDAIIWLPDGGQLLKEFVDSRDAMVKKAAQLWSAPSYNAELTEEQKAVKLPGHCTPKAHFKCVALLGSGGSLHLNHPLSFPFSLPPWPTSRPKVQEWPKFKDPQYWTSDVRHKSNGKVAQEMALPPVALAIEANSSHLKARDDGRTNVAKMDFTEAKAGLGQQAAKDAAAAAKKATQRDKIANRPSAKASGQLVYVAPGRDACKSRLFFNPCAPPSSPSPQPPHSTTKNYRIHHDGEEERKVTAHAEEHKATESAEERKATESAE
jgi:hypothetical protein